MLAIETTSSKPPRLQRPPNPRRRLRPNHWTSKIRIRTLTLMLLTFSRKSINEVPAVESTESTTEGQNSTTDEDTNHVTNNNTHETRPVPMFEALKQPEHIDRWNTHTPEVAAEVADSAALLDLPTPEPEASDELVDDTEAELPLAISDIAEKAAEADIAAEVADTAETLDADEASQIQLELLALMRIDILIERDWIEDRTVVCSPCTGFCRRCCRSRRYCRSPGR